MSSHEDTLERLRERAAAEAGNDGLTLVEPDELAMPEKKATREYIVFVSTGSGWKEEEHVTAGSAEAAIRKLGDKLKPASEYAACPARNWTVGTPEIETTTSIKIALS